MHKYYFKYQKQPNLFLFPQSDPFPSLCNDHNIQFHFALLPFSIWIKALSLEEFDNHKKYMADDGGHGVRSML